MQAFIHKDWQSILEYNKLSSFDDWWRYNENFQSDVNHRRGGWSGVLKKSLTLPDGKVTTVYLKRQYNHPYRSWRHPIKGEPTFRREIKNIQQFLALGIDTITPVYYGERKVNGQWQAILVTKELENFVSLEEFIQNKQQDKLSVETKRELVKKIALFVKKLHQHHYLFGCLYAKHIFIQIDKDENIHPVHCIDLEKAKKNYSPITCMVRDLSSLYRSMQQLTTTNGMRFIKHYFDQVKLGHSQKNLLRQLIKRNTRKQR